MTLINGIRMTALTATLAAAAGTATPLAAQSSEGETIRERVVVTLPNGRRIVRMVERPAPAPAVSSSANGDPFRGSLGGNGGVQAMQDFPDGLPPEVLEWMTWYLANDILADANGDGRVTTDDYAAFIQQLNGNNGGGGNPDPDPDPDPDGGGTGGNPDDDTNGDGGGGPGPSTIGWTQFEPSSDTIKIHVSESGNDANDGRTPQTAVRTIDRGKDLLRDGKPDWLLLRAGDSFREPMGDWKKSGRSSTEPLLVSSYGNGARPKILTGTSRGLTMIGYRDFRKHIAFVGLHFEPGVVGSGTGISFTTGAVQDILIEDCYIANYDQNIVVQGQREDQIENVRLRRNVIVDASGSTHSQGIFAAWLDGLLLEENIFDRNGWDYRQGREATATIFAHNVYIQKTTQNVVARGNISTRASSHGMQARTGGVIEENVYARNPIGLLFANDESTTNDLAAEVVRNNLVIEGVHLNNANNRSWGIHIQDIQQVLVSGNIVANSTVPDRGWGMSVSGPDGMVVRNAVFENNVVDDYGDGLRIMDDIAVDVTLRNNAFTRSGGDKVLVYHTSNGDLPGVNYEGNLYEHRQDSSPFDTGGRELTMNEWQADFDPMGGRLLTPFVDEGRTLDDFAQSRGFADSDALFEAWRNQSRQNWDERITSEQIRAYFAEAFALPNAS